MWNSYYEITLKFIYCIFVIESSSLSSALYFHALLSFDWLWHIHTARSLRVLWGWRVAQVDEKLIYWWNRRNGQLLEAVKVLSIRGSLINSSAGVSLRHSINKWSLNFFNDLRAHRLLIFIVIHKMHFYCCMIAWKKKIKKFRD